MALDMMLIGLKLKDQKARKDLEEVAASIEGVMLREFDAHLPCDLLILEIGEDSEKDFQFIHSVQASGLAGEFFLTSSRMEPDLLIRALRAGAKEFLPQPMVKNDVRNALLKFIDQRRQASVLGKKNTRRGRILNVMGSKGGVGTTTVAVNLATSLVSASPKARSVALIDMNLLFGEIPIFLNLHSSFNWAEVAKNISRLDSTYLMSILSKHESGVCVLPSPTGLDGISVATPEVIETILTTMRKEFDFIVIDSGQSLDDISLKILEMSDVLFLVSILSLPCLTNVKKLLWTFQRWGYPRPENIKIIVNRYLKKSLISLKEAEGALKQSVFSLITNDYSTTMSAINQGKTITAIDGGGEIAKDFKKLAANCLQLMKER